MNGAQLIVPRLGFDCDRRVAFSGALQPLRSWNAPFAVHAVAVSGAMCLN
jgi:hypothetical protein